MMKFFFVESSVDSVGIGEKVVEFCKKVLKLVKKLLKFVKRYWS